MSAWFPRYLRRGGRVHFDQLSPKYQALVNRIATREATRALERGHRRRPWLRIALGFLLVIAAGLVGRYLGR